MDNFQLNTITGYYQIPVTLHQEAGEEFIKNIRPQTFKTYRFQSHILGNKPNKPKSIYEKN